MPDVVVAAVAVVEALVVAVTAVAVAAAVVVVMSVFVAEVVDIAYSKEAANAHTVDDSYRFVKKDSSYPSYYSC